MLYRTCFTLAPVLKLGSSAGKSFMCACGSQASEPELMTDKGGGNFNRGAY